MPSIFVSYSSTDTATAIQLREHLVAAGYTTVFRDKDDEAGIPGGTNWAPELFSALDRTDIVVFLATPASLASPWCHTELAVAVAEKKFVAQVSTTDQPTHPLLKDRQRIPPEASVEALVGRLVHDLTRVGLAPRDPFTWDPDRSPYPGLQRLDETHAAVLFGRDAEIAACIQRLSGSRPNPLLVTGPSGSGKSSMVRAGVLPRLKLQPGTVVLPVVEPGNAPSQRIGLALSEADAAAFPGSPTPLPRILDPVDGIAFVVDRLVARTGGRVILFLDQAEDLVERTEPSAVEAIVHRLAAVDAERLVVVAAVRSVSLDDWLRSPALGMLARSDPVWVRPLDRPALREVITGPAHVAGIRFEPPELVDRILDDTVGGNALPLLAALLEELTSSHSRREPAVVTTERYEAVGPVAKVIERRAEQAAAEIETQRHVPESAVVDAYLRLADVDDQTRVTAAEVPIEDLTPQAREILDGFEQHRLVTRDRRVVAGRERRTSADGATSPSDRSDGPARTVDIVSAVHEAVFRAWPAVAAAIRARQADLATRTWLGREARTWDSTGRGQAALTGGRLAVATDWSERHGDELTPEMRDYLRTAVRQVRRRRILTVAVPILLIVSLVVGGLAVRAVSEADRANGARAEADALRLVGEARQTIDGRPDLSALLAMEAASRSNDLQILAAPLIPLVHGPGPRRFEAVGTPIEEGRLDEAGQHAVLDVSGATLLWDVSAAAAVRTLERIGNQLAISGDGSKIARDDGGRVVVTTWADGNEVASCPVAGRASAIQQLALSMEGDRVAVAWEDPENPSTSRVAVLDLPDCTAHEIGPIESEAVAIDLDAGGLRIAVAQTDSESGPLAWEVDSGQSLVGEPPFPLTAVQFGSEGRLAGLGPNGDLSVWTGDGSDAEPKVRHVDDAGGSGSALALVPSTSAIVTASDDGQLRKVTPDELDLNGPALFALAALDYEGPKAPLDVASDGSRAVTIDRSGRVIVWDLDGRAALGPRLAEAGFADKVAPLSDRSILIRSGSGARLLDSAGRIVLDYANESVAAIAVSGDRWAFATGGQLYGPGAGAGGAVVVPVAAIPTTTRWLAGLPDGRWVAASPDVLSIVGSGTPREIPISGTVRALVTSGRWIFVGDGMGSVHILDADNMNGPERVVQAHAFDIGSLAVNADGTILATGSDDRTIALWAIGSDGGLLERSRLRGNEERVTSIAFNPDGHWLASASEDNLVRLFNLDGAIEVGDPIPTNGVATIAFDPAADRRLYVATTALDVWDLRFESWRTMACEIIGSRRLVTVEKDKFLRGVPAIDPCR